MIFDIKHEELYKDLEDWLRGNCPARDCCVCPIGICNNRRECSCGELIRDYPAEALKILKENGIVKEVQSEAEVKEELEGMEMENVENVKDTTKGTMENVTKNTESKIPPLCQILGVQPYQAFSYEDEDHRVFAIGENGVRYELNEETGWKISYDEENLVELIQHPEKIVRRGDAQGLRDLVRMHKAKEKLKKILPGTEAVTELDGKFYVQVVTMKNTFELVGVNLEALE